MIGRRKSIKIDFERLAERLEDLTQTSSPRFEGEVVRELERLTEDASQEMASLLLKNTDKEAKELRKFRDGFEARLQNTWNKSLNLFEIVQTLCLQLGADLNEQWRSRLPTDGDFVFEALRNLHGRACLTASEVHSLLRSGHATGGMARWRTLHEIAVVAFFISEQGSDVARRYLEHDTVQRFKVAQQYQQFAQRLGHPPLSAEEVDELHKSFQELKTRYGNSYTSDYGWAGGALKKPRPTFRDIRRSVDMDHWSPYIRMASHGVHSGPRASNFDLGVPTGLHVIPAGPSHFGLAQPGTNALISLRQAAVALLTYALKDLTDDSVALDGRILVAYVVLMAKIGALQKLVDEALNAFDEANDREGKYEPSVSSPPEILKVSVPKEFSD